MNSRRESEARRKYARAGKEAIEARDQQNWRLAADKLLEATMIAPSKNDRHRFCFFACYVALVDPRSLPHVEILERDRMALKQISADESEPVLFRIAALYTRGGLIMREDRKEKEASYYRRILKLSSTVGSSERSRVHSPFLDGSETFTTGSWLGISVAYVEEKLRALENPNLVPRSTLESVPRVNGQPNPSIVQRLTVGGNYCDCCEKHQAYSAEDDLFMRCSLCKKAYYCSRKCQEQQWDAGHKNTCREPNEIQPGDLMLLFGLQSKPELNDKLVHVVGPADTPGRWEVSLYGRSKTISVAPEKLVHIRPAI